MRTLYLLIKAKQEKTRNKIVNLADKNLKISILWLELANFAHFVYIYILENFTNKLSNFPAVGMNSAFFA